MGRFFNERALKWGLALFFIMVVAFVQYIVVSNYNPKDAFVEVVEDVIEYKTGIEVDLNNKEPEEEMPIMVEELPSFFLTYEPRIVL